MCPAPGSHDALLEAADTSLGANPNAALDEIMAARLLIGTLLASATD